MGIMNFRLIRFLFNKIIPWVVISFVFLILVAAYYNTNNYFNNFDSTPHELSHKQKLASMLIYSEADTNDPEDMYLIGSVVLNRTNCSSDFPNSVDSVIFQRSQFYGVYSDRFGKRTPATDSVVVDLYYGIGRVYDIYYFYNPELSTDSSFINWANSQKIKAKSGSHIFF